MRVAPTVAKIAITELVKSENKYVYCRGSYATLSGSKALISGCFLGVNAFFFALQHRDSYGFLQSTYRKNYLVETIPIKEYNMDMWE